MNESESRLTVSKHSRSIVRLMTRCVHLVSLMYPLRGMRRKILLIVGNNLLT